MFIYRKIVTHIFLIFLVLFFIVPLIIIPVNYELFEFNKILFVYIISSILLSIWMIRMIVEKRIIFEKTPFGIFLALFFLSQVISTIYSIDPHISLWGYYGRFNGGLFSLISYLIIYFTFVSNNDLFFSKKIKTAQTLIYTILASGVTVSLYGFLQHFGIDAHLWVQDVQRRVFSTLGQPNWLAALLDILLPILFCFTVVSSFPRKNAKTHHLSSPFYFLALTVSLLYYVVLLFTKSRSGFIAFWITNVFFWTALYMLIKKIPKTSIQHPLTSCYKKLIITIHLLFLSTTFIVGTPFPTLNNALLGKVVVLSAQDSSSSSSNLIITDSGKIRQLVWKGAIDAVKERPIFGWGVETFAWVYYRFRPVEHNMTSEWDFIYNKAHNEYLNYAATTGLFGILTYSMFILAVIIYSYIYLNKKVPLVKITSFSTSSFQPISYLFYQKVLFLGFFSGWISILITNFFGFSIVVTSLYFFLIPAILYVLIQTQQSKKIPTTKLSLSFIQYIGLFLSVFLAVILIHKIITIWMADYYYALAREYRQRENYISPTAYIYMTKALSLKPLEPEYKNFIAGVLAPLAVYYYKEPDAVNILKDTDTTTDKNISTKYAQQLAQEALSYSDAAIALSPGNVSFWKTRTRIYYMLSDIDPSYGKDALQTILYTLSLAPTDPKLYYNAGILYELNNDKQNAISMYKKALSLKENYRDPAWALGVLFEEIDKNKAKQWYQYILDTIDPQDKYAHEKISHL